MNIVRRALTPPSKRVSTTSAVVQRSSVVGPSIQNAYAALNQGQQQDWNAESAIRRHYMVNVIVYRCAQVLAETIASLPFRAGRDITKPMEVDLDAPLAKLLGPPPGGPNPDLAPSAFWANYVANRVVTGRYGSEIEWSGKPGSSKVVALWPLASQHIRPIATRTSGEKAADGVPRYFSAFEYAPSGKPPRKISSDRLFYDWEPALQDFHQAMSPLAAARLDVAVAVKQDIYDNAFLDNDARPAGLLVTSEFATQEDYDAFEARWNDKHGGPSGAGKVQIVEREQGEDGSQRSIEWISLGISQKDADFFRRYEQKIRGICIAMGVPMSMLDASGRTFDNAEQERITFEVNTVIPLVRKIEGAINARLAPLVGREVGWFDLSGLTVNRERVADYLAVSPLEAYREGVYSLNMTLKALGQEARREPEADVIRALEPDPDPVVVPQPEDEDTQNDEPQPEPEAQRELPIRPERGVHQEAPATTVPASSPVDHRLRRERQWRSIDAVVTTLERQWERQMRAMFARQAVAVSKRLTDKRGRQALTRASEEEQQNPSLLTEAVFTYAFWRAATEEESSALLETILAVVLARLLADFDLPVGWKSTPPPRVAAYLKTRSQFLGQQLTSTTYDDLNDTLTEGIRAGEGVEQLVARSNAVFDAAAKVRAPLIATTEVMGAHNNFTELAAEEMTAEGDPERPVVGGKEWIGEMDDRIRPTHRRANGQVRRIGEKFEVGEVKMRCPHDPTAPLRETAGCRCAVALIAAEDMGDRGVEVGQYRDVEAVTRELIAISLGVPS